MCVGAMLHARISKLVFGAYDFKTGAAGSVFNVLEESKNNHQISVQGGVLEEQSAAMLQAFFKARR